LEVEIKVKPKHIKEGRHSSPAFCPVALAINDILPPGHTAGVYPKMIYIVISDPCWPETRIPTPPKVATFERQFDNHFTPSPFTFTLDIPEKFLKGESNDTV
jgi:hypothetical protein